MQSPVSNSLVDVARIRAVLGHDGVLYSTVFSSEALALFDKERLVFAGEERSSPHFVLYSKGKKDLKNCGQAPRTCALLETFPEASGCRYGTIKFSSLPGRTHIGPHVGRTNTKLQVLVGLHMDPQAGIRIRVAEDMK